MRRIYTLNLKFNYVVGRNVLFRFRYIVRIYVAGIGIGIGIAAAAGIGGIGLVGI